MVRYFIDGNTFTSIEKAKDHIRKIIGDVGLCKSVKKKNKPVFKRLAKFLSRHHDAIKKGVIDDYDIEIKHNLKGDWQLAITKEDGFTTEDISWVRCINPKEKTHQQKLSSAMRDAIQYQIQKFKEDNPDKKCSANPCPEKQWHSFDVDHLILFKKLQMDFFKIRSPDIIKDFDSCPQTNKKRFKESDAEWKQHWQEFHKKNAILRWLCRPCNLKRKKNLQNEQ